MTEQVEELQFSSAFKYFSMTNFYNKNMTHENWRKALVLGFLLLALTLTSLAQSKKSSSAFKSYRKSRSEAQVSGSGLRTKTQQNSLRTGTRSRQPRNGQEYFWEESNNTWRLGYNHAYTYNSAGLVVEELVTEANNSNFSKYVTKYDSHNRITEDLQYYWEDNAWLLYSGYRTTYTYANEKITEIVFQSYYTGVWEQTHREVYTYNTLGYLAEVTEYDRENNAWVAEEKTIVGYNQGSNRPISFTYQEWESNAWVNTERDIDLVWHDFDNVDMTDFEEYNLSSYTYQEWANNAWVNVEKETTTYQANGSYVLIDQNWENGAWVNDSRTTYTNDAKGNFTLDQEEEWQVDKWVITYGFKAVNTYNATDDLTEVIYQEWSAEPGSATTGSYKNEFRMVYTNFQNVLSSKEELSSLAALVYPNPVASKFTVKLEKATAATVKVLSLSGQMLLTSNLTKALGGEEINISALPAGTYILQIQSRSGVSTQKIVKR